MAIDELQTLAIITYVLDFLITKKKFLLNEVNGGKGLGGV